MPQYSKTLSQQLGEVSDMLSMSYVARAYFGKSRSWISQRLHGNIVNGKPAIFTPSELETLRGALKDMSELLDKMSKTI